MADLLSEENFYTGTVNLGSVPVKRNLAPAVRARRARDGVVRAARAGRDPFDPGDLREARTAAESMVLHHPGLACIIVSASGMASGGRVVHHLADLLPDR
jgi:hypothetical protein